MDTVATEICELPKLRYLNLNGNPNSSIPSCLINSNKIVFYNESSQVKPKSRYYPKSGDKFDFGVFKSVPATKENSNED